MTIPKQLWLIFHNDNEVALDCLAYKQEPTHGAFKYLVTPVIKKSEADKLAEALDAQDCKCGEYPTAYKGGRPIIFNICNRCLALKEYRGE